MEPFTPGELAVMQILWEHGELKPAEVQQRYPEPIKNPALRSYLTILVEKGHVTRRKVGKAYFYKAKTKQTAAFKKSLASIIQGYCDGSVRSLMLNLIRTEKLSEDDLLELKRLADEATQQGEN